MQPDWQNALTRARAHAPFLARGLERLPELAELLAAGRGEEALAWARQAGADIADVRIALRRERLAHAVALAIGDLAGVFPVGRVMQELSELADRALDAAIGAAIARRVPGAPNAGPKTGMIALALGKHGAQELNYSSDIDPILLFDPETLPRRDRDEPGEAAQRYARDIVQLLAENTAEGYVFRVDLRLRPASEVSPLAISLNAALTHYESSALTWERAAFIRARACSGDVAAGEAFLAAIRPFVWRRSLDFGAIEEIGRLTARIRDNYRGAKIPGPGFNLKHGRGGLPPPASGSPHGTGRAPGQTRWPGTAWWCPTTSRTPGARFGRRSATQPGPGGTRRRWRPGGRWPTACDRPTASEPS